MPVAFTVETLRALANSTSYQRGQGYFRAGAVRKITQTGPVFTARVMGSEAYQVRLDLGGRQVDATCSCPYDYDGICKHIVALGLAVIKQFDLHHLPPSPGQAALDGLNDVWERLSDNRRLTFLLAELRASPEMAQRFHQFAEMGTPAQAARRTKTAAQRLVNELIGLSFDEEELLDSGYDYDDEGYENHFYTLLAEAFGPTVQELLLLTRTQALPMALTYWTDIAEALTEIEEPAADDFGFADDYPALLLHHWNQLLTEAGWFDLLPTVGLAPADGAALTTWLKAQLKPSEPVADHHVAANWEPLLLALARHPGAAKLLLPPLTGSWLPPPYQARIRLQAAKTLADDTLWVQQAELLLTEQAEVAEQLLAFYTNRGDGVNRLRVAAAAFKQWPQRFTNEALTLPGAEAAPLRLGALRYRCRTVFDWADFEQLTALLPPAELAAFVDDLARPLPANDSQLLLVARAQHQLGRYADLLARYRQLDLLGYANLTDYLALLAPHYPAEALDVTVAYVERGMAEKLRYRRGHQMYQQFAAWLAVFNRQPTLREQVRTVVSFLFEQHPALHVLKKYLREAGLVTSLPAHLPVELLDEEGAMAKPPKRSMARRR